MTYRRKKSSSATIWLRSGWLYAGLALALTLFFWLIFPGNLLAAWLLAFNISAFISYGVDKRLAETGLARIPERFLLGLALAGGSPGAWLAMQLFRHKTRKRALLRRFWLIAAAQAALVFLYWALGRPGLGLS